MNITHEREENNLITEEVLLQLGFERKDVDYVTSGGEPYTYYCLELHTYLQLLSNAIEDSKRITVSVLQCGDAVVIKDRNNLERFVKACRDNINNVAN